MPVIAFALNQLAEVAGMVPEAVRVIVVLAGLLMAAVFFVLFLERYRIGNERRRRQLPPPGDDWSPQWLARRRR
ncbi:hypothetical protein ACVU7I_00085 [Patulibacter sp. S7RM1-6]